MTQSADLGNVPNAEYGISVRQGLNLSDEALASMSAGPSAPPATFACMLWHDTALHQIKQRDEANTGWRVLMVFATTAPGVGDDSADLMITGTLWADAAGKKVYICADPAAGAALWVEVGAGSGGATITGTAGRILIRTAGGGEATSAVWDADSETILHRGLARLVTDAGTVTTTWAPALGAAVGDIITADTAADLTLAVPTGDVPPTGYRAEYQLAIQNTAAEAIVLSYPAYTIEGESGPLRKIPAGATQYYWIATEDGGTTWRILGTARRPVAVKFWASGTPGAGEILYLDWIVDPILMPLDHLDITLPVCRTAPSAAVSFIVQRESGSISSPTTVDVLRATFASGQKYSTWTMWDGEEWVEASAELAVEWQRGERMIVIAPANLYGLAGLAWSMVGGEREYQG